MKFNVTETLAKMNFEKKQDTTAFSQPIRSTIFLNQGMVFLYDERGKIL